jgi:hypothetical protein
MQSTTLNSYLGRNDHDAVGAIPVKDRSVNRPGTFPMK